MSRSSSASTFSTPRTSTAVGAPRKSSGRRLRAGRGMSTSSRRRSSAPPRRRRGLSREQILKQIDASLERLGMDFVDLYQCHSYDNDVPLEEQLGALTEVVDAGKARYIGVSNWSGAQIRTAVDLAREHGFAKIVSSQPEYSLLVARAREGRDSRVARERRLADPSTRRSRRASSREVRAEVTTRRRRHARRRALRVDGAPTATTSLSASSACADRGRPRSSRWRSCRSLDPPRGRTSLLYRSSVASRPDQAARHVGSSGVTLRRRDAARDGTIVLRFASGNRAGLAASGSARADRQRTKVIAPPNGSSRSSSHAPTSRSGRRCRRAGGRSSRKSGIGDRAVNSAASFTDRARVAASGVDALRVENRAIIQLVLMAQRGYETPQRESTHPHRSSKLAKAQPR